MGLYPTKQPKHPFTTQDVQATYDTPGVGVPTEQPRQIRPFFATIQGDGFSAEVTVESQEDFEQFLTVSRALALKGEFIED